MNGRRPRPYLELPALVLAALFWIIPVGTALGQPQGRVWGYLEYQGRYTDREEGEEGAMNLGTVRVNGASYLWRPWFAQVSGGLGLTWARFRDGIESDSELTTGEGRLNLFPKSHFPFEAHVERDDTRVRGDVVGPDYTLTRYRLSQQYNPPNGGRYRLRYRHGERTQELNGTTGLSAEEQDDQLGLELERAFGSHNFRFTSEMEEIERQDPGSRHERELYLLRHTFRPRGTFSWDNMLSFNDFTETAAATENISQVSQLSSVAFWRPRTERPLLFTANILASSLDHQRAIGDAETQSVSLNGGATYQWTPHVTLRAALATRRSRDEQTETHSESERLFIDYNPDQIPLGDFMYRWSANGQVGNRSGQAGELGTGEAVQELGGGLGHTLGREFPGARGGSLSLRLSERVNGLADTEDSESVNLVHSASLGWNRQSGSVSTLARLSLNDRREYGDQESTFQLVNVQVTRNHRVDQNTSWNGNVTIQASRSVTEATNRELDGDWDGSSSISLTYQRRRVMDVPRLDFTSELRVMSHNLLPVVQTEFTTSDEREDRVWRNRLTYNIGLLELNAWANFSQGQDRNLNMLLLFQARRRFSM